METSTLQRVEKFVLYSVLEKQIVTELDSPAPGLTSQIASRTAVYDFFSSQERAQEYLESIRTDFMGRNNTLKLKTVDQQSFLDGHLDYKYAHTFEVYHTVTSKEMLAQKLPENLEELLASPRRQIAMDMKHDPHNHAHGFLPGYVNDLLKIVLF
ncbi:MAG: hypothetical protein AABX91_00680 [Nanoarchaeota archaeon]